MKYELDSAVEYEGVQAIVWDYSHRYEVYTLKLEDSTFFHGVREADLEAVDKDCLEGLSLEKQFLGIIVWGILLVGLPVCIGSLTWILDK